MDFEIFKDVGLNLVKEYGYLGIFLIGLSEPIFQPIPTEIFIISGVLLGLDWKLVLIVSTLGCNLGAIITYCLATKYGEKLALRLFDEEKLKKGEKFLKKWGVMGVIVVSFTPIPFEIICWVCGMFNMPFEKYMVAVFLSRMIKHGLAVLPFVLPIKNYLPF
ncbi:YqaA family protein [Methanotorris igneus]|uniref:SNARE associated Golgi protein n=1 Tax=Methanotorris igneus (strain DSM 5666 / JCM 11834 / Kol 5) TaxID=880724 RepID=F6BD54_METIK|nr:YqaA family protein [Methanotorris igneus]AEF96415.1 SNARE associated Golgi protein [Methanotorris igneus Kol 5]